MTPTIAAGSFPMTEYPKGVELRKHTRYVCVDGGAMRLSVRPEFRGRRAMLLDLSVGGIGFLLEEALAADTALVFEVQGPGDTAALTRVARVCHCRAYPTPDDAPWAPKPPPVSRFFRSLLGLKAAALVKPPSWLVGCMFERPLDEDELKVFLERLKLVHEFKCNEQ